MRVQSPIAGHQSGSVGGMVFQTYHGRTYMRAKPVIFHYQPTPAQKAAQDKYYSVKSQLNPAYRLMRPYFPQNDRNGLNYYNTLSKGIFEALQIFPPIKPHEEISGFGVDLYKHISIEQASISVLHSGSTYRIRLNGFTWQSNVDFTPQYAHALMFCTDLHEMQYQVVQYTEPQIIWPFSNSGNWFPNHQVHLYMALSNDERMSNYFY